MKANEFMIGDWVFCTYPSINKPVRVAEIKTVGDNKLKFVIYDDIRLVFNETYIDPTPLTPEILEKNGFESTPAPSERVWKHNGQEVWLDNEGKNYWANIKNGEFYFEGYIEHTHQLQHALRLCGIKKEIKL